MIAVMNVISSKTRQRRLLRRVEAATMIVIGWAHARHEG
jgi:hypothetical protein